MRGYGQISMLVWGWCIGVCRFSICLPPGISPWCRPCGRFVIVFNGEIYNHQAIGVELDSPLSSHEGKGYWNGVGIRTQKRCWRVLTPGASRARVERAIGMFAFAVWDKADRTLTLAVTVWVKNPFTTDGRAIPFLFGSELKALKAHPAFRAEIDRNALALLMRHNYIPAPYSIYQGIHKLLPGSLLTISLQNPNAQAATLLGCAAGGG